MTRRRAKADDLAQLRCKLADPEAAARREDLAKLRKAQRAALRWMVVGTACMAAGAALVAWLLTAFVTG